MAIRAAPLSRHTERRRGWPWLILRVVATPAPTQGRNYASWDEAFVPYPHCDPDFESGLQHTDVPPRLLHALLCAFALRQERIVDTSMSPAPWRVLYIRTDKTLYLCYVPMYHAERVRFVCAPVR